MTNPTKEAIQLTELFKEINTEPLLREAFPNYQLDNALFDKFTDVPWSEEVASELLNLDYFGNHSGGKFCAPIVKRLLGDAEQLTEQQMQTLARLAQNKFHYNWLRLWQSNIVEYSPIDNYDMMETYSRNTTGGHTEGNTGTVKRESTDELTKGTKDTTTHGKTEHTAEVVDSTVDTDSTDTVTHNTQETTTHGKTDGETVYHFGFNSPADARNPSDLTESVEGGTTTVTNTGTDTDTLDQKVDTDATTTIDISEGGTTAVEYTGKDTTTLNQTDTTDMTKTEEDETTEESTLHRKGNIGVTTNQKLLTEERELWIWNFFEQVYKDLDSLLTLAIFDPCGF